MYGLAVMLSVATQIPLKNIDKIKKSMIQQQFWLVLSSVRSYKRITHPQKYVIHSEKALMLLYLLYFHDIFSQFK